MKIQLERKLSSCSNQLACAVCRQPFMVQPIRTLLFSDKGLLLGDICLPCRQSGAEEIRDTLRERSILLKRQAEFSRSTPKAIDDLVAQLTTCAKENVTFPSLFEWALKRWELLVEESAEVEAARLELANDWLSQRTQLDIRMTGEKS
jgi:hypothetical protein